MRRENWKKYARRALALLLAAAAVFPALGCAAKKGREQTALAAADFILSLQTAGGAVRGCPGDRTANQDSDMEYALMALGAAYQKTGQKKYLAGLERGITWLADCQELQDPRWRGSWWYLYDLDGRHVPAPSEGVADVRGVDTTCGLFVYLLDLDRRCAGAEGVWKRYRANGQAALDFLLHRSRDSDGLTWSSFQKNPAGEWNCYRFKYAADQGDVWLGYRAGAWLYGGKYRRLADALAKRIPQTFFEKAHGRYCVGVEADGSRDWTLEDFSPIQAQGYLPWLLGDTSQNRRAVSWLASKARRDGSLRCYRGDPGYSLSAALLVMGQRGMGEKQSWKTMRWLTESVCDSKTGGVYDSPADRTETCNVAGFCVMALLNWEPFGN